MRTDADFKKTKITMKASCVLTVGQVKIEQVVESYFVCFAFRAAE